MSSTLRQSLSLLPNKSKPHLLELTDWSELSKSVNFLANSLVEAEKSNQTSISNNQVYLAPDIASQASQKSCKLGEELTSLIDERSFRDLKVEIGES